MLAIFFVYFVLLALQIVYSTLLLTLKIGHREMNLDPSRKLPRWLAFRALCRMLLEKRHQCLPGVGPIRIIIQTCQARCADRYKNERIFQEGFLERRPSPRVGGTYHWQPCCIKVQRNSRAVCRPLLPAGGRG